MGAHKELNRAQNNMSGMDRYLRVPLVVGNSMGILLVEVKSMLHQELDRLGLNDVLL